MLRITRKRSFPSLWITVKTQTGRTTSSCTRRSKNVFISVRCCQGHFFGCVPVVSCSQWSSKLVLELRPKNRCLHRNTERRLRCWLRWIARDGRDVEKLPERELLRLLMSWRVLRRPGERTIQTSHLSSPEQTTLELMFAYERAICQTFYFAARSGARGGDTDGGIGARPRGVSVGATSSARGDVLPRLEKREGLRRVFFVSQLWDFLEWLVSIVFFREREHDMQFRTPWRLQFILMA